MTTDEKKEIEQDIFNRLYIRMLICAGLGILSLILGQNYLLKGEQGPPGPKPTIEEIAKAIKDAGLRGEQGPPGEPAKLPSGAAFLYLIPKKDNSKSCAKYCYEKDYTGCIATGQGESFGDGVKLHPTSCDVIESPTDCLCYK